MGGRRAAVLFTHSIPGAIDAGQISAGRSPVAPIACGARRPGRLARVKRVIAVGVLAAAVLAARARSAHA